MIEHIALGVSIVVNILLICLIFIFARAMPTRFF